ncbi:3824_t:CDS:2 [Ambispora leptoticha]|uniref:3824_t:CDS:1 n=1 Tax=Ambispora leptoticha TaxID=144679 RepID=A0A9N9FVG3_9GLOM|nr:3824_t:CDS:2 [Ambispora leptoticha]
MIYGTMTFSKDMDNNDAHQVSDIDIQEDKKQSNTAGRKKAKGLAEEPNAKSRFRPKSGSAINDVIIEALSPFDYYFSIARTESMVIKTVANILLLYFIKLYVTQRICAVDLFNIIYIGVLRKYFGTRIGVLLSFFYGNITKSDYSARDEEWLEFSSMSDEKPT